MVAVVVDLEMVVDVLIGSGKFRKDGLMASTGLKVVGEVKKVGKSRNFHPKVGKSRNFSVLKVGKSRNFINVFITSLHTGTSIMLVSFLDFEANHLFSKKVYSTPN